MKTQKMIIVTGCAGFIGSNFCERFRDQFLIVGIDCFARGSHSENVSKGIVFYLADIADKESLEKIIKRHSEIEGIINFAAESHVDHSLSDDHLFWKTNVLGVRNLSMIARQKKIRLLQVSTDEVYGPFDGNFEVTEASPLNPRNPYAASKAAADLMLLSYHQSYGMDCVITRGTNTIGPRQALSKAIPKAIVSFLEGMAFPLYKTPARRMWLSVNDHCDLVRKAFLNGKSGEIYNVSPNLDHEIETGALIERVRQLIGTGEIRLVPDRLSYDLSYRISSQKARIMLQWEPREEIFSLIENTVRWYLGNVNWIKTHPEHPTIGAAK